jgi:hypothetical protein
LGHGRVQWGPACAAGLIAGVVLLVVPHASPWEGLTSFSRVIMGRALSPASVLPLPVIWLLHLALSLVYGVMISAAVSTLRIQRAILVGGLFGLALYLINLAVVSLAWPEWNGSEGGVILTHLAFGFIAAGAYRGLLRRVAA